MVGRELLFTLSRRVFRSKPILAFAVIAVIAGLFSLRHAAAEHAVATTSANAGGSTGVNPGASVTALSLAGRRFEQSEGSLVVGEFEGSFDAATRTFTVAPKAAPAPARRAVNSRFDPGAEVPPGSGFAFSVVASRFIGSGDNAGTVSGEVQIANNSSSTLYNTRLVFTAFKIGGPGGADAGNVPGASGFAYFNDGQIPYNGKLSVSRYYGDIPASGNAKAIWTFSTVTQPPSFFFAYRVLADIGAAAESVQPSAVQVNATGTSVLINGRGFNNPTVELLQGANVIGQMPVTNPTATSVTATVPANTAAGNYSVRVTNQGATAGGAGSSTLVNKLTVTGVPDGAHTISGNIGTLADTGPYLISGNATIASNLSVKPGTVFYIAADASITVAGSGNITAHGGVPGIPGSAKDGAASVDPAQIVFTALRAPGGSLPETGDWAGINAIAASSAEMALRNVRFEYGGAGGGAGINITGSGRKLRITDSVVRGSAGVGLAANGVNDSVVGFTRNRIEGNGSAATDPAVLLSGNASLGLFDLPAGDIPSATSVGDGSYFFSSANEFSGNQLNAVQIGLDADNASNDFTKSGVLTGQGTTPIRIRGTNTNPAIVGAASPAPAAELVIGPTALIQLAPGMDFMAGDPATNKSGSIAANGFAGVYLAPAAAAANGGGGIANRTATPSVFNAAPDAASDKFIEFNNIPGAGNFGAVFFTKNAIASSILNWVKLQGGGNSSSGAGTIIVDTVTIKLTNSQINGSTNGLLVLGGANVNTTGSNFSAGGGPTITTIAGGIYGDGNPGAKISMGTPVAIAADPQGRGVYFADATAVGNLIRFFNTSTSEVTLGGNRVAAGTIRTIAGGGLDPADNAPGRTADTGSVSGLAVNPAGDVVYFIDSGAPAIRAINVSSAAKSIGGQNIGSGAVGTLASQGFGSSLNGLAVHPSNGDVYVADATAGSNKVFSIPAAGGSPTTVAGSGTITKADDAFSAGPATGIPLLQPRAIVIDSSGAVYIADTGHGRVIKVQGGQASLMRQFPPKQGSTPVPPYNSNPFSSGLAIFGGKVYVANGNSQDIARIDGPGASTSIAGTVDTACDYSSSNCGDSGAPTAAAFGMLGSTGTPPLAGIAADSKGLFVLDQGSIQRGRIRYINLSAMPAVVGGLTIAPNIVDTVAGTGLAAPFDGGLATSAGFNTPTGVAVDPQGNLWISDMLSSKIRFVNRGSSPLTLFAGTAAEQAVAAGSIATVNKDVGTGSTDGVPANLAGFDTPQGLVATAQGVFIADSKKGLAVGQRRTGWVRFINTSNATVSFYTGAVKIDVEPGFIKTIAGGGVNSSDIGDGAAPLNAKFLAPEDIALHPATGDIYIADAGNKKVRKIVRSSGAVSSMNLPAGTSDQYTGVAFDSTGRLLVVNAGGNSVLREKGVGTGGTTGFDAILSGLPLNRPRDVAQGPDGALYVTNTGDTQPLSAGDYRLIRINISVTPATASTYSGGSTPGYSGDGGAPGNAQLNLLPDPISISTVGTPVTIRTTVNITIGLNGEIVFADSKNNAIRRIK